MRRIHFNDLADHEPVEKHAQRSQVLLDRGGRQRFFPALLVLQVLDEGGYVVGPDLGELARIPWASDHSAKRRVA
jgi:hypothetical protein